MMNRVYGSLCALVLACAGASVRADSTVVFNEIMYHPLTNELGLEWVELHNQMAVDMDLSGWKLDSSIHFTFPEGTVMAGGGYLVVAVSPATLMAATGLTNVLGPFDGRLSNAGETIELRNNNDRVMDSVKYGVDGDWPIGCDGAGPSLAKYDEDSASDNSANWRTSSQAGGTPGAANFPQDVISVVSSMVVASDAVWNYDSSGTNWGTAWREAGFNDSAWASGAGLLYAGLGAWQPGEVMAIPMLFSTGLDTNGAALAPGFADPHYVLTESAYSTPPPPAIAATVMANNPAWLANDAASVWIGAFSQGAASVPAGNYNFRTSFDLTGFATNTAQITVQLAVDNNVTNVLLNGVSLGWSYSAFASLSSAFARGTGFVAGTNTLEFLTVNSGASASPGGFRAKISGTATKRAPLNTALAAGPTTHYFRKAFVFTGDPSTAALRVRPIVDDGAVFYLNGTEVLRLNLPAGTVTNGTPATINVGNANYSGPFALSVASLVVGTNILAVETHQTVSGTNDVLFGAELTVTATNLPSAPAPTLALNEISPVTGGQFWVEIVNYGTQSVAMTGYVLGRFSKTYREFAIPSQTLPAGGYLVLDKATVGFGADPSDKVVLYGPGKTRVLDAVLAKKTARARFPEATGPWLSPFQTTPGTSNSFALHNEIVFNEIMYHPPDLAATPEVRATNLLVTITNGWRYNQSGYNLGTAWSAPAYDDSLWSTGKALLYTNFSSLPAPLGTKLRYTNGVVTYYFRTPFVLTNDPAGAQVVLRHVVNDGAIFYVNGVEITRFNMPAGPVYSTNYASVNVGVPTNILGPFAFTVTNLVVGTNVLAVEVHEYAAPPVNRDACFGAELSVTTLLSPALPVRSSPEAWVELYNRSTNTVDLTGWRLDNAIHFDFPTNQTIAPGGYLVVAEDAAFLRGLYPAIEILGDFGGSLSHSGSHITLKDVSGNPADELTYGDGKPWPDYADGGGSSIELRDPFADNAKPQAWAPSVESGRAGWVWFTNRMVAANILGPTTWNELQFGLLDAGECLIDDLHVIESPTNSPVEMLQNGTFETGLSAWRALGDHSRSRVEVDPDNAANHVLHLIATGATTHQHNHLETTYASSRQVTNGREYQVSFRAKWLAGNNRLNTRLYFNRVARTFALPMPQAHGTPGALNSTFATNVGPTFESLAHSPIIPATNEPVTVRISASDPQGVSAVTLWWSTNFTAWQTVAMSPSGGTASPGYANYAAALGGFPAGTLVQFFVQATDGLGAVSTFPAAGTNSRALFRVDEGKPLMSQVHRFRLLMRPADADLLHAPTNVMSDDLLGVTVVYDEHEVFYDAGIHLQSSERGRNDTTRVGFTVKLNSDHLFRGVQDSFTIDRSGGYSGKGGDHDEILLWRAVNHAGGLLGLDCDLLQLFAPRAQEDSTGMMRMSAFDGAYFDNQFSKGSDGNLYKMELIYYPLSNVVAGDVQTPKLPQPDAVINVEIQDWGDDTENYRWPFLQENHGDQDDYTQLIAMNKAFSLTGTNLDAQTSQLLDLDEWLRTLAFKALLGDGDTFTYGNNHNFKIYFRPKDGKALGLLWDMDFSFVSSTSAPFPGTGSANTYKLITTVPANLRLYRGHLLDLTGTTGDTAYLNAWAARYAGRLGQDWSAAVTYLSQRATWVRSQLPALLPFAVTNYAGSNFVSATPTIQLGGTAGIDVKEIGLAGSAARFALTWPTTSNWLATITLSCGTNALDVLAYDFHGNPIATNRVTATLLDTEPPVITTCAPPLVLGADANCQTPLPDLTSNIFASDNCSVTVTQWPPAGTILALGVPTPVVFTAFDPAGNSAVCSNVVTVLDTTPPALTCPTNLLAATATGQCSAVVPLGVMATDDCDPAPVLVCAPTNGFAFPVGTTLVNCLAHDASGNTNTCAFTVTVTDNTAPQLTCSTNLAFSTDGGQCSKSNVTFSFTATDNCAVTNSACLPPSGSTFAPGTNVVTCTAQDSSGNSAQCAFLVTVTDHENPQILCPGNLTLTQDAGQTSRSNVTYLAEASDNCAVTNLACVPPSGSTFPVGTNLVTCTARDASGNSAACAFNVTVIGQLLATATDTVNLRIPDGSPAGLANSVNIATPIERITEMTVTLNVTGGFNGDLHAYLVHDSGHAILLNRAGKTLANPTGYSDAGFNVAFADTATNGDIHNYRLALSGNPNTPLPGALTNAWAPDGRDTDPALVLDTDPRPATLSAFTGLNPNGRWTLFIADVDALYASTLVSWGLQILGTNAPPVITAQPRNRTNVLTTEAVFTVTATGLSTPSYQWYLGSAPLSGATNAALHLPNVQATNAGSYSVRVTTIGGSALSQPATLTVIDQTVNGTVEMELYAGPAGHGTGTRLVTFKGTDATNGPLASWNLPLNFTNAVAPFTLAHAPLGLAHLSAKTAWHLRTRLPVSFTNGVAAMTFTGPSALRPGDLDESNTVDFGDYFILAGAWYTPNPVADLDGSGWVDLDDYFLQSHHWQQTGDPE